MKPTILPITIIMLILAALPSPGHAQGELLTHLDIPGTTISPNGDGLQDSLTATFSLADSAWSVSAYILTAENPPMIVDILLFETPRSAGNHTLSWKGEDRFGIPAPEGTYHLLIEAFNAAHEDTIVKTIYIYLTPPAITITRLEPGVFAPDVVSAVPEMVADFTVTDSPPEDEDQIRIFIEDPDGTEITTLAPDSLFRGNGDYQVRWDGTGIAVDGPHRITIIVTDNGQNSASDWSSINVDDSAPALQTLDPPSGSNLQEIPASMTGWTWDRNGINTDSLRVSFSGETYDPITIISTVDDTVFFTVPLTDSITAEGEYSLFLQSQDVVGRQTQISYRLTIDATAPDAPVLIQPDNALVRKPVALLTGISDEDADMLRIFRNGTPVDSLTGFIEENFSLAVTLVPGSNSFTARAVDEAGNVSPPSNTVTVTFNNSAGLFIPQPFEPGDEFQLNLARDVRSIELRIYDLAGDLVQVIEERPDGRAVTLQWNGLNGDDKSLKRGPLVLVARIVYLDGETESQRELFLFKP